MSADITAARAELDDPDTAAARLMSIAQEHPSLGYQIAAHPNAYPELIEWLSLYGAAAAQQAEAARTTARATATTSTIAATTDAAVPAITPLADVESPTVAESAVAATVEEAEEWDVAGAMIGGAVAAVSTFNDFGMMESVADASRPALPVLESLLVPGDDVQIAIPCIYATNPRFEAISVFTQDRLILVWGGAFKSKGHRVILYSDVRSARVGAGPHELSEHAALYIDTNDPVAIALPTDSVPSMWFLTDLVKGVPLETLKPWDAHASALSESATPVTDHDPVAAELANSYITGARLAEIAETRSDLHPQIAAHPKAYPNLLDWLESREDLATRAAVSRRRAQDHAATSSTASTSTVAAAAPPTPGTSGWEKAEAVMDGAGRVVNGIGSVLTILYGVGLIILGIVIMGAPLSGAVLGGLIVAAYGVYLALPLNYAKWVVW